MAGSRGIGNPSSPRPRRPDQRGAGCHSTRCPAASWKTHGTSGRVRNRLTSLHRVSFRGSARAFPFFGLLQADTPVGQSAKFQVRPSSSPFLTQVSRDVTIVSGAAPRAENQVQDNLPEKVPPGATRSDPEVCQVVRLPFLSPLRPRSCQ